MIPSLVSFNLKSTIYNLKSKINTGGPLPPHPPPLRAFFLRAGCLACALYSYFGN